MEAGGTLIVDVTVVNQGGQAGTEAVELDAGGQLQDISMEMIEPGEEAEVALEWVTEDVDVGDHTVFVSVGDSTETSQVTVEQDTSDVDSTVSGFSSGGGLSPAEFTEETTVTVSPEEPEVDDRIHASVDVMNTGGQEEDTTVELIRDGTVVEDRFVSVPGYMSEEVTLSEEAEAGEYEVTVGNETMEEFVVDEQVTDDEEDVDDSPEEVEEDSEGEEDTQEQDEDNFDDELVDEGTGDAEEGLPGFTPVAAFVALLAVGYRLTNK